MKKILCAITALILVLMLMITTSAKTVLNTGDWVLDASNSNSWEIDTYIGSAENVTVITQYGDIELTVLSDHAFANNSATRYVVIPAPINTLGDYVFLNAVSLVSVTLQDMVNNIGIGAFSGTSALKVVNLEDTVVSEIMSYTFLNSGIESISLPETSTKIGIYAFCGCSSLRSITIPNSVTEIADNAFSGCDNLVIYANHNAYAIQYAMDHNIPYEYLDAKQVTFVLGDADGDGDVTILDATKIQRVLADLDDDPDGMIALRADSDEDELDIMDATRIQRWLAEYEVAEPIGDRVNRAIPLKEKETEYPQNDSEASTESSTEILTE